MTYSTERKIAGERGASAKAICAASRRQRRPTMPRPAARLFIPMLTLGVPGLGTTAVMLGALTLYNITPGPQLFSEQPDIVWGLIASLFIGNVILLALNIPLVGFFARLLNVPELYSDSSHCHGELCGRVCHSQHHFRPDFDGGAGRVGYTLRKLNFPLSALILGYVLGEMTESSLRRALSISQGDLGILFHGPIAITLWALSALMVALPLMRLLRRKKKASA